MELSQNTALAIGLAPIVIVAALYFVHELRAGKKQHK